MRIFVAIEQSERKVRVQQLFRRVCCYGLALLHKKGTSIDPVVWEIQNALPHAQHNIRQKVYHILRIGTKWAAIIEQFASILSCVPQELTGLLCLLGSAST